MYICIYMFIYIYTCMYIHIHIFTYICSRICMYMHIYYMYIIYITYICILYRLFNYRNHFLLVSTCCLYQDFLLQFTFQIFINDFIYKQNLMSLQVLSEN